MGGELLVECCLEIPGAVDEGRPFGLENRSAGRRVYELASQHLGSNCRHMDQDLAMQRGHAALPAILDGRNIVALRIDTNVA
jgi:hypothetical protein